MHAHRIRKGAHSGCSSGGGGTWKLRSTVPTVLLYHECCVSVSTSSPFCSTHPHPPDVMRVSGARKHHVRAFHGHALRTSFDGSEGPA